MDPLARHFFHNPFCTFLFCSIFQTHSRDNKTYTRTFHYFQLQNIFTGFFYPLFDFLQEDVSTAGYLS
jgi:hypothetical protein